MKKIGVFALILCLILAFGCKDGSDIKPPANDTGTNAPDTPSVDAPDAPDTPTTPDTPATPDTPDEPLPPEDKTVKYSDYIFQGDFKDESVGDITLVNVSVQLPKAENNEDIQYFYNSFMDKLKETVHTYYLPLGKGNYEFAQDGIGIFTPVVIETSYQVVRNDGVLFSVVRESYENTGGAHPMGAKLGDVFRIADGAKLLFEDVFTVTYDEALAKLTPIIHKQMDDFTAANGLDNAYYENAKQELFSMWETDDFYLTDESLVLIWQAYSIAPYAAGIQEFSIPLADIADIVDAQWITK